MKKILFLAAAALAFAACSEENVFTPNYEPAQEAIGFTTFKNAATRGAENSNAASSDALSKLQSDFRIDGKKIVNGSATWVFSNQAASADGTYSPVRYWDKSASSYSFYAAAPASGWTFNETTCKYSYANLTLDGKTIASSDAIDKNAKFGDYDLLLAHDVTGYASYSSTAVNLEFDHILTRINIGVKKADVAATITLNSVKLFNLVKKGSFDESAASADASGSCSRWTPSSADADKFTSGVGNASAFDLASGDYKYIYQALYIPQKAGYDGSFDLDGSDASGDSKPYIVIDYSINGDNYKYYYNLAKIFGKSADLSLNEGWMNTLLIKIDPAEINFTPVVYEWALDNKEEIVIPQ